jgi:hypothetical protein
MIVMNLSTNDQDIVEAAARWLEVSGFEGDLSAVTAGLHDIAEVSKKIEEELLPLLLRLSPRFQHDEALGIMVDLKFDLEHIAAHARDAIEVVAAVCDFLDHSPKPGTGV